MFQESPFSGACAASTWEVILMLVGSTLLGLLLGYLIWGWVKNRVLLLDKKLRELQHIADLKDSQVVSLQSRLHALEEELDKGKSQLRAKETQYGEAITRIKSLNEDIDALRTSASKSKSTDRKVKSTGKKVKPPAQETIKSDISEPVVAPAPKSQGTPSSASKSSQLLRTGSTKASLATAATVFGRKVKANDLKLIEGIGPKIEQILNSRGIKTWAKLAESRLPALRQILEDAGSRYRLHDPKTWARQSRMAAKGEWKKLMAYQDSLKGGK